MTTNTIVVDSPILAQAEPASLPAITYYVVAVASCSLCNGEGASPDGAVCRRCKGTGCVEWRTPLDAAQADLVRRVERIERALWGSVQR